MNVLRDIFAPKVPAPDSVPLPDPEELALICNFKEKEIHRIFERFCSLVNKETGCLEKYICVQQAELSLNPLIPLAFDLELKSQIQDYSEGLMFASLAIDGTVVPPAPVDLKRVKGLDFTHFLMMLSKFSHKESRQVKRQYFFQIVVQDRKIEKMTFEHFHHFMMRLSNGAVTPYVMEKAVQDMWTTMCGSNKSAVLTPQHMPHLLSLIDVHQYMTISF